MPPSYCQLLSKNIAGFTIVKHEHPGEDRGQKCHIECRVMTSQAGKAGREDQFAVTEKSALINLSASSVYNYPA